MMAYCAQLMVSLLPTEHFLKTKLFVLASCYNPNYVAPKLKNG